MTAKEHLEELIRTEEDLNNFKTAQGLEESFAGVCTYIEEAVQASSELDETLSDSNEALSHLQEAAADGIKLSSSPDQLLLRGKTDNKAELDYLDALTDSYQEFRKSLDGSRRYELDGLERDGAPIFNTEFAEDGTFEIYSQAYRLTPDERQALETIIKDNVSEAGGALSDSIDAQAQELQAKVTQGENAWRDFIPSLVSGMRSKQTFKDLDPGLQDAAVQLVENLDSSYASAMKAYSPDPYAYIRDNFIVPMGNLNDSDKQKLQSGIAELFKLDAGNLSQNNQKETEKYISTIAALLEKTPSEIRVMLGFDIQDELDRYKEALAKAKHQLGGYRYDNRGFEANNATGSKLDDFWSENVATEEDQVLWQTVTAGITDAQEAMEAYTEARKKANAVKIDTLSFDDAFGRLENIARPVMDAVENAWSESFNDDGTFDIDPDKALGAVSAVKNAIESVNSNKALGVTIDTSSLETLAGVLSDTSSTADEVQQAYSGVAGALMDSLLPALQNMDASQLGMFQSFMQGMGILNAEELIIQQLGYSYDTYAAAKEAAAGAGIDLANATTEDILKFAGESAAAEEDKIALLAYYQYKIIASGATIDTNDSITQLLSEYEQLGINCEKLKEYLGLHGAEEGSGVDMKYRGFSSSTEGYDTGAKTPPKLPDIPKGADEKRAKTASGAARSAKTETNALSGLNSEMDRLQSSYKSLCDIRDTYNQNGKITVDQYQELTNMGFTFLSQLVDENGQLGLNASAFERLSQAKLEEMQIQMARNAADTINGLKTEAAAVEYLTYANEQLRNAALGAAEAELEAAVVNARRRGGSQAEAASQIYQGYQAAKQMAGKVDFSFTPASSPAVSPEKTESPKKEASYNSMDAYNREKSLLEHMLALDQISKAEYYEKLLALARSSFEGDEEHQDQIWDAEESYHDYLESIKETYNWIEIFLENLSRKTSALIDKAGKFISWSKKNAMINRAVKATDRQIAGQNSAYVYYAEKARRVGLSNSYINKIQNGTLTMEDMQNESLSNKIEKYQVCRLLRFLHPARIQDRIMQILLPVLWRSAEAGNRNNNLHTTNSKGGKSMDDSLMEVLESSETQGTKASTSKKQKLDSFDWASRFLDIAGLLEYLKVIPEEALKVDAAMTQLGQSSGASASELQAYFGQAAKSAQKYGVSVSDLIGITAEWSRMGYGLPDAHALAEAAALYSHITGMDPGASSKALASTMQGLHLEAGEVGRLLDMLARAGNDLSVDPAGIGRALQESAASFRAANTDLLQSVALTAGTDSIMQDPSAVADLWNTVEMHVYGIRQELEAAGTETDGMLESTAQLRDLVQNLTGFDIMADSSGTQLKDLYSIIVGIGQEWQNLSASEQGGLLDALAGSQGDALGSVLDNVSRIEDAYQSVEKSSGAALKAQEKYEQGIQYSLDRLKASFQQFTDTLAGDGLLKGVLDFGNGTVNVLDFITDKLGVLGTLGTVGGAVAGAKGAGLT